MFVVPVALSLEGENELLQQSVIEHCTVRGEIGTKPLDVERHRNVAASRGAPGVAPVHVGSEI